MIISWGGDSVSLGSMKPNYCTTCEKDRPYELILGYKYFGFFFIFNMVTEKHYYHLCSVCRRGSELEAKEVERHLEGSPFPFMMRYGLLIGAVVGFLLMVFMIIADEQGIKLP